MKNKYLGCLYTNIYNLRLVKLVLLLQTKTNTVLTTVSKSVTK